MPAIFARIPHDQLSCVLACDNLGIGHIHLSGYPAHHRQVSLGGELQGNPDHRDFEMVLEDGIPHKCPQLLKWRNGGLARFVAGTR